MLSAILAVQFYPKRKRGNAAPHLDTMHKRIALLSPGIPA
jgi:hypothetical protein